MQMFMEVTLIHGVGDSQGINPYSYIFNNPLAGTDPSGYEPVTLTILGLVGAAVAIWGAFDIGHTVGTAGYEIYNDEKTMKEAAIDAGTTLAIDTALSVTGTKAAKLIPDSLKDKAAKVVKDGYNKIKAMLSKNKDNGKNNSNGPNKSNDNKEGVRDNDQERTSESNSNESNSNTDEMNQETTYGPFHRLGDSKENINSIKESGEYRGNPPKNYMQSDIPKAQAYDGPLPENAKGFEFTTTAKPDKGTPPGQVNWSGNGHNPDVKTINDQAVISCTVTKVSCD